MENQEIITVDHVSMRFSLASEKIDSFKEYVIKSIKRQLSYDEFWALKDVSFSINRGDALGLIGLNGSGKSTMLKVIAGVLKPTKGTVTVRGSVAPLIELGAGFDMDLTATENVYLNGALLGYSRQEMEKHYNNIVEFSELHDFMNVPVKNFSSGMISRLGFAIATIGTPDILIVDEVLSVGDFHFQEKCQNRIKNMLDKGTTLLFVSHSISQVESLCNKRISYEMNFLIGNICDLIEVDGENEEQVDQRNILTLLQKKVKYGVPNMTAISICESVFNDRLLAIELAQILSDANIGTDKILNMLKAHSEEIFSCLDSYPEYFKDRLSVLMK